MEFIRCDLEDVILVRPDVHSDERGFLFESYSRKRYADNGITAVFVQDNHSRSVKKGVVRGLHFQVPPYAQNKLLRVTGGFNFRCRRRPPETVAHLRKVALV
jgi:dTDP-4-dehydrorhamnose 3,5-epimerase